jgi:type IV pilus assembly protein PilO
MALIPDDPRQRTALVAVILAAGLFYLFWSYWYTPAKTELEQLTSRLEQLEANNRRAQLAAARGGAELEARLAVYERHVDQLEQLIPQSEEVPALLNAISAEARRANLNRGDIATMRPEPDEAGAFYTKHSYVIEVIGDYHDIGRFLTAVASLTRIITPVDVEIVPFQGDRSMLDPELEAPLTARLRIQTFILPSGSAAPPPTGAPEQRAG